ncbi:MAG: SPOR domain-containing protein [Hyphomicrobium sp.]
MGIMTRNARCASLVAALAVSGLALSVLASSSTSVLAVSKTAKAAPPAASGDDEQANKASTAEAAKRAFDGGVKSYQAGKLQPAVDQLSTALRGGGLVSTDMARGLYYRGLAYKKQNKPGLAISDLTSALWLKNGLSEAERQSATAERAEAYKSAGLGDGNSGADKVAAADPKAETAGQASTSANPATTAPAQAAEAGPAAKPYAPAASVADTGIPQPLTMGAETAAAPGPQVGSGAGVAAAGNVDQVAAMDQPRFEAAGPAQKPVLNAVPADNSDASSMPGSAAPAKSTIAGFFSDMFSGSSAPSAPAPAPASTVTTASTTQAAPQSSSWSDTSSVAEGSGKKGKAAKHAAATGTSGNTGTAAVPAPVAKAEPKAKGGKYKLHIAAVRSRAEADALAQKLTQQYGGAFASRAPAVDEAVIGSMGTFYRVRVGSYATADEPRGLCNTLRNGGYDCLVVSN